MLFFTRFKAVIVAAMVAVLCVVPTFADAEGMPVCINYYSVSETPFVRGVRASPLEYQSKRLISGSSVSNEWGYTFTPYGGSSTQTASVIYVFPVEPNSVYSVSLAFMGHVEVAFGQFSEPDPGTNPTTPSGITFDSGDDVNFATFTISTAEGINSLAVRYRVLNNTENVFGYTDPSLIKSSDTPMGTFLSSLSAVPDAILNAIVKVAHVIMEQPMLLLVSGIMLLGASVAIFCRCLKRS